MAAVRVLLKAREARRVRRDLIQFLEALRLFLRVGWDLSYAWSQVMSQLGREFGDETQRILSMDAESFANGLRQCGRQAEEPGLTTWFCLLADLYESGASLSESLGAFSETLRREHQRDLEQHARRAPTRTNLCLLLFFLPTTLALILLPVLWKLLNPS